MSRFAKLITVFSAASLVASAVAQSPPATAFLKSPSQMTPAELAAWKKTNGSYYVQCDGDPDNMSAGEMIARLVALSAVIGLLAPAPEDADPAKRKFGAEGVAACSRLIEGDGRESSASRRLGLVLARGAHRIEAKNFAGAILDAELARKTAAEAGILDDVYWRSGRGRGPDLLEAAALYRQGKTEEASAMALRNAAAFRYAIVPLLGLPQYHTTLDREVPGEKDFATALHHLFPSSTVRSADRLEQLGRFADAATLGDALMDYDRATSPNGRNSLVIARTAVSHALAGNDSMATTLAAAAQANFDARKAAGKPEPYAAEFVEEMDLYGILRMAGAGDVKGARRLFAARSQWLSASFGSIVEVNRRLRTGAAADELVGGLAQTPDALWKARAEERLAAALTKDADNKTLFAMFPPSATAKAYEAVAKQTWKTDKSPWLVKSKRTDPDANGFEMLNGYAVSPIVLAQAYTLHAALFPKRVATRAS